MTYPDISWDIPKINKTDGISWDIPDFLKKQMGYPWISRLVNYPWIPKDKYVCTDLYQPVVFLHWKNDRLV